MTKFKNAIYITGQIVGVDLKEGETKTGVPSIFGTISVNTANNEEKDNIIPLRVYQVKYGKKAKEEADKLGKEPEPLKTYTVLKDLMENPENNIGRLVNISTKMEANVFQGQDGNLVENADISRSMFFNSVRPNQQNKAIFTGDARISKEPIELVDKDDNPVLDENGKPKSAMTIELFDDYNKLLFPVKVVIGEAGAKWAESVAEDKMVFNIRLDLINHTFEEEKEVESAFGEPLLVKRTSTKKEKVLSWANSEPLDVEPEEVDEMAENYVKYVDKQKNAESVKKEAETKAMEKPKATSVKEEAVEEFEDFDW